MYQNKFLPYAACFLCILFISFHGNTTSCNVDQYNDPISYIMHLASDDNMLSQYERIMLQRALQGNTLRQQQKEDVKNTLLRILHNENVSYNGMDQLYEAFDVGDHVKRNDSIVTRNSGLPHDTTSREPRDPEQTIESESITEPITLNEVDTTSPPSSPTGNFVEVPGDTMTGPLNFSATADPAISGDQDICFATDGTVRWCFTQEGGVEASLNSTAVNPGDSNLDSGYGFNLMVNADANSQAESLASSSQSYGYNVAMGPGAQATTDNSSDAVNIAIHEGRATGTGERANGFNFATRSAEANSDNAKGFNFASSGATALSLNDGDGFNFAAGSGASAQGDFGTSFNYAGPNGTASSGFSFDGLNFATRDATAQGETAAGMNFAVGGGTSDCVGANSFNFATEDALAESRFDFHGFNFAAANAEALGRGSGTSGGFNFAAKNASVDSDGNSGINFAGESTGIATQDAAHAFNVAVTGDVGSSDSITIDDGDGTNANRLCNVVVGQGSSLTIDDTSQTAAINAIADGGTLTNPGNGINMNSGTGTDAAMRVYTNDTYRWRFTREGGVDASLNGSGIVPGDGNLDSSVGFNMIINGDPTTQAESLANNSQSFGYNVAINPESQATTDAGSSGVNFISAASTGSMVQDSSGFNFAAGSSQASISDSFAFNVSLGNNSQATAGIQTNAINMATDGGRAEYNEGGGFSFAAGTGAAAENDLGGNAFNFAAGAGSSSSVQAGGFSSNGFHIAIGEGASALSTRSASSFNYAGLGATAEAGRSGITNTTSCDSVNFATRNATASGLNTSSANNDSAGFNFAAKDASAESRNSSGFNFAALNSAITANDASHGFNFVATNEGSGTSAITTDASGTSTDLEYFNIAIGSDGSGNQSTITMDAPASMQEAINMAVSGSTINNDAGNGVNIAVGDATLGSAGVGSGDGVNIALGSGAGDGIDLRLFNLPAQSEDDVLTINSSNGVVGITDASSISSTRQVKRDIASISDATQRLLETDPCEFRYRDAKDDGRIHYGMIAEELAHIMPELVRYDTNGEPSKIRYIEMVPLLVKHIQDLRNIVSQQHEDAICMQAEIDENQRTVSDYSRYVEMIPILMHQLQQQQEEIAHLRSLCDA